MSFFLVTICSCVKLILLSYSPLHPSKVGHLPSCLLLIFLAQQVGSIHIWISHFDLDGDFPSTRAIFLKGIYLLASGLSYPFPIPLSCALLTVLVQGLRTMSSDEAQKRAKATKPQKSKISVSQQMIMIGMSLFRVSLD